MERSECSDSLSLAERELAAFVRAVSDSFGSELAEFSAEAWLRELESTTDLPTSTREWRRLTFAASLKLANRMTLIPVT